MNPIFKADDGSEHASPKAASRRNELLKAKSDFNGAARRVIRLLLESAKTADGDVFEAGGWRDYWQVVGSWHGLPSLRRVSVWGHDAEIECDRHSEAAICVREFRDGKYESIRIDTLYSQKKNAEAALRTEIDRRLEQIQKEAAELKAGLT